VQPLRFQRREFEQADESAADAFGQSVGVSARARARMHMRLQQASKHCSALVRFFISIP